MLSTGVAQGSVEPVTNQNLQKGMLSTGVPQGSVEPVTNQNLQKAFRHHVPLVSLQVSFDLETTKPHSCALVPRAHITLFVNLTQGLNSKPNFLLYRRWVQGRGPGGTQEESQALPPSPSVHTRLNSPLGGVAKMFLKALSPCWFSSVSETMSPRQGDSALDVFFAQLARISLITDACKNDAPPVIYHYYPLSCNVAESVNEDRCPESRFDGKGPSSGRQSKQVNATSRQNRRTAARN